MQASKQILELVRGSCDPQFLNGNFFIWLFIQPDKKETQNQEYDSKSKPNCNCECVYVYRILLSVVTNNQLLL